MIRVVAQMTSLTHRPHVGFVAAALVVTEMRNRQHELASTQQNVSVAARAAARALAARLVAVAALATTFTAPPCTREADTI